MARHYVVNNRVRLVDALTSRLARLGMGRIEVLTTVGRRSGVPRLCRYLRLK